MSFLIRDFDPWFKNPGDRSHPYRKDRWRLHCIFGSPPSRGGKPLWQLGDSTGDLESQANIESYVVFHVVSHAWFICFSSCILFMVFYFIMFNNCDLFAHTHVHLHNISSKPELRPFRRKCWLRSREIVISAMASQTLPEFMVLMTSWGCNLRTVIRKCSHSNRTLSVACNGWGSGCLTSPLGTTVRNDLGTF